MYRNQTIQETLEKKYHLQSQRIKITTVNIHVYVFVCIYALFMCMYVCV